MSGTELLHFSLGPVQGFVAQARRTRDLWAGSFILSWLSGQAMRAVLDGGGEVLLPQVKDATGDFTDPMLAGLYGTTVPGHAQPKIGTLPNRFMARVPSGFAAKDAQTAVSAAWGRLAAAVWKHYLSGVLEDATLPKDQKALTQAVWDRQVPRFWEVQWVRGADPGDGSDLTWLDLRKNWRSHWPTAAEGGDHCTVMGDWQELSGRLRSQERGAQNDFWQRMRTQHDPRRIRLGRLELRDDERLCAIALVKRLFPKLPRDELARVIGWVPSGIEDVDDDLIGSASWPSTAYMAAVPWLRRIAHGDAQGRRALDEYFATVHLTTLGLPERAFRKLCSERLTGLACLEPLRRDCRARDGRHPDALDGNLFLETALQNARVTPLSDQEAADAQTDPDAAARAVLTAALRRLSNVLGRRSSPIYAVLLMDGDHMGKLLRADTRKVVPAALGAFALGVEAVVRAHCGVTVYAGGDDVLALLPLESAIDCAMVLRGHWGTTMTSHGVAQSTAMPVTASAAVIFAHFKLPLRAVLREAHHQLDSVAKAANGRDSVALALLQGGGKRTAWVSTWCDPGCTAVLPRLSALIGVLGADLEQGDGGVYPRGFFHKLRDRYPILVHDDRDRLLAGITPALVEQLFIAEYLRTQRDHSASADEVQRAVAALLDLCWPLRRQGDKVERDSTRLQLGVIFLARFMATELAGRGSDADPF